LVKPVLQSRVALTAKGIDEVEKIMVQTYAEKELFELQLKVNLPDNLYSQKNNTT